LSLGGFWRERNREHGSAAFAKRLLDMAQVFPPDNGMPMARLDMALADVALAKQLAATLAGLGGPCGALRSQRVAAAEGPPWVKYVLFDAELGIALIDFAPACPSRGIVPLQAFLAESGFTDRYRGDLPVVAMALAPSEIPLVTDRIAAAFAAAPPCAIADTSWCEALNRLLMTADGLTMARVMPTPGTAAPGPLRLAEAGPGTSAAPAPLLPRAALERPFLQQQFAQTPPLMRPVRARPLPRQPMPERPLPKRAPLRNLLLYNRDGERPMLQKSVPKTQIRERQIVERPIAADPKPRPAPPGDPMRLRTWHAGGYRRAALAMAALSAAALAIGGVPYLVEAPAPAMQAPIASGPSAVVASATPIRSAAALDGMASVSEPSVIAVEPQSPASAAEAALPTPPPVNSAAALDGAAASEPLALAEEERQALANPEAVAVEAESPTQPSVRSSAIDDTVEAPSSVSETVEPPSVAAAATPVWGRASRPAAKPPTANSAAPTATRKPTPIWRAGPARGVARTSFKGFVIDPRKRETR
jgi:hypothetical protein